MSYIIYCFIAFSIPEYLQLPIISPARPVPASAFPYSPVPETGISHDIVSAGEFGRGHEYISGYVLGVPVRGNRIVARQVIRLPGAVFINIAHPIDIGERVSVADGYIYGVGIAGSFYEHFITAGERVPGNAVAVRKRVGRSYLVAEGGGETSTAADLGGAVVVVGGVGCAGLAGIAAVIAEGLAGGGGMNIGTDFPARAVIILIKHINSRRESRKISTVRVKGVVII